MPDLINIAFVLGPMTVGFILEKIGSIDGLLDEFFTAWPLFFTGLAFDLMRLEFT